MWYYSMNNQPVGPVEGEMIKSLLSAGRITLDTLVWQEGMPDWVKLGETALVTPAAQPVAPVWQRPQSPYPQPYQPQPYQQPYVQPGQVYQGYPVNPAAQIPWRPQVNLASLRSLFTTWVIFAVLAAISSVGLLLLEINRSRNQGLITGFSCFVEIVAVTTGILLFVLLYRLWKVIQDGMASTTPGKAVGFLFIPFFNFYWFFVAFFGLSLQLNKFIDRHFPTTSGRMVRRSHPGLALIYCILFLGNIVLTYITLFKSFSTSMSSIYSGGSAAILSTPFMITNAVVSLIYSVFLISTFSDLYQTAASILSNYGN